MTIWRVICEWVLYLITDTHTQVTWQGNNPSCKSPPSEWHQRDQRNRRPGSVMWIESEKTHNLTAISRCVTSSHCGYKWGKAGLAVTMFLQQMQRLKTSQLGGSLLTGRQLWFSKPSSLTVRIVLQASFFYERRTLTKLLGVNVYIYI